VKPLMGMPPPVPVHSPLLRVLPGENGEKKLSGEFCTGREGVCVAFGTSITIPWEGLPEGGEVSRGTRTRGLSGGP